MKPTHLIAAGLLAASTASALINIDTAFVGDAGNANDSTGFGGVSYDYYIGTYEVTNAQYTAFLNATAATDTHSLYNSNMSGISRAGSSGSYTYTATSVNTPVNYVSFWDAARFTNWLTNGQGSGDTETGVYNLNGTTNPTNNTITRNTTVWDNGGVAIASENEWYKAAYYDGNDGYTLYPTQSNSITTADANYDYSVGTMTDVGTYSSDASHYGTFDQGGNVWELNDQVVYDIFRGRRGAAYLNADTALQSTYRFYDDPHQEYDFVGFRVSSLAPIPEPSTYAAILGGIGLSLALIRRKARGTL